MNASPDPDTPVRTAPMALWRVAEAFMRILFALFGAPEDVAERHTLRAEPYRLLLSWLRCGEAMMRRLLLIEAAAYPKPNTRPLLHPQHKRVRKLMGFDAEHPEKWRVSFRCFTQLSGIGARESASVPIPDNRTPNPDLRTERWNYTRFKPVTFHSAWRLAE